MTRYHSVSIINEVILAKLYWFEVNYAMRYINLYKNHNYKIRLVYISNEVNIQSQYDTPDLNNQFSTSNDR